MNRLTEFFDPLEPELPEDYYVVQTYCGSYVVSRETASDIERRLDQLPTPRWIVFRDLAGSRFRVLTSLVYRLTESTAATRAADRAFDRARRLEEKQDRRPWEDDD